MLERAEATGYVRVMLQMLEKRVDELERRVAELAAFVGSKPRKKDWAATVGTLPDDEMSREAERLGRDYRDSLRDSGDRAGT